MLEFLSWRKESFQLQNKKPYSNTMVGQVPTGVSMKSSDDDSLILHSNLPAGFDVATRRTLTGTYVGKRRWVKVHLATLDGKQACMAWFLVDTGGTHSYLSIHTRSAAGWVLDENAYKIGCKETQDLLIEGLQHRFVASEVSDNSNVWDINLLGADLLQYFTLIDDSFGQTLLLIPRTQKASAGEMFDF